MKLFALKADTNPRHNRHNRRQVNSICDCPAPQARRRL